MDSDLDDEAPEGYQPPLNWQQAEELDRRLMAHRRTPEDVIPWESIKPEISKRYR